MAERTAQEWLEVLEKRLHARWERISKFEAYYEGDTGVRLISQRMREAFPQFRDLKDNYMKLVVDTPAERLRVQGLRFGEEDPDDQAWEIWQANGLDTQANMVHTEAIKLSEAYWLVNPLGPGNIPRITAEHPSQVIVAYEEGNRRNRVAALKEYQDEEGYVYANVYLPDRYVRYRTKAPLSRVYYESEFDRKWETIGAGGNPLGVVPIVPMPNNPTMLGGGQSDLDCGILSLQDQINGKLVTLAGGEEYIGLPVRVILGLEPPRDSEGKPIRDVEQLKSRFLYLPNQDASIGEFKPGELTGIRDTVDSAISDIAAQARIPIFYFNPSSIANISAEGIVALEAGLVSKVNDKKDAFGEGHEEMIRLAFKAMNASDSRAEAFDAETVWTNTENRSEAQTADAVLKKQQAGVPWEQCMEDLGYSPQQIDRMRAEKEADELLASLNAPQPEQPEADEELPAAA